MLNVVLSTITKFSTHIPMFLNQKNIKNIIIMYMFMKQRWTTYPTMQTKSNQIRVV